MYVFNSAICADVTLSLALFTFVRRVSPSTNANSSWIEDELAIVSATIKHLPQTLY